MRGYAWARGLISFTTDWIFLGAEVREAVGGAQDAGGPRLRTWVKIMVVENVAVAEELLHVADSARIPAGGWQRSGGKCGTAGALGMPLYWRTASFTRAGRRIRAGGVGALARSSRWRYVRVAGRPTARSTRARRAKTVLAVRPAPRQLEPNPRRLRRSAACRSRPTRVLGQVSGGGGGSLSSRVLGALARAAP